MKLYKSTTGLIHLIFSGYLPCNYDLGKIGSNMNGNGSQVTCKNCRGRMDYG